MTPRTRSTNKDANYKVYYSKKVPQQVRFPHRRKTVRQPLKVAKDGGKKQMKFLPEMMRIRRDLMDSEEENEEDEDLEDGGVALKLEPDDMEAEEENSGKQPRLRGQKRRNHVAEHDLEDDAGPPKPTPKRRRQDNAPRSNRRSRQIAPESEDEDNETPSHANHKVDRSRTLRRQSTMTQLVDGRRPMSDAEEPAFKPVKRGSRHSWGGQGKNVKDKNQRTLTQMIPGMMPLEIDSDEDMEEGSRNKEAEETEERDSQAYGEAIAARLAQEGLVQNRSDDAEPTDDNGKLPDASRVHQSSGQEEQSDVPTQSLGTPSITIHSAEDTDEEEESYQPTQFIDAPITRTRRSSRQSSARKPQAPQPEPPSTGARKTAKSNFGLLSTPEKRRIREIPSSQSPPDSPLSTQTTPSKADRLSLHWRSSNPTQAAETPSKRKQVTFQTPSKKTVPPPTLKKFKSTILDSEDEECDLIEEDDSRHAHQFGASTQAQGQRMDSMARGRDVGHETQAMLDQIDQACAHTHEDDDQVDRESSEELGVSTFDQDRESSEELGVSIFDRDGDSSQELGDLLTQRKVASAEDTTTAYRAVHIGVKQEPLQDHDMCGPVVQDTLHEELQSSYKTTHTGIKQEQYQNNTFLEEVGFADVDPEDTSVELPITTQVPSSPPVIQQLPEETCPSTPMVIMDSSDEEDDAIELTPQHQNTYTVTQASSHTVQQSADLNNGPIQVPRSPTLQAESQKSHSSKAELQIQNEWFSYSQYFKARPAHTSSMNVAHDKSSYDATPRPPRPTAPAHYMSQATTVDEVTPRKSRTHRTSSAIVTPHKIASSQPLSSPSKPPPLFIPSSFPSPSKARMDEWSSPVYGRTQDTGYNLGSLEDFSIPLPPPLDMDDD